MSGGCGGGGTKSLRLPPRTSRLSLSLLCARARVRSIALCLSLSFLSNRFTPHFPLRPTLSFAPAYRLLFFPFATAVSLALFFSLPATPLFMPPHSPGSSPSRARFPLYPTRAIAPSLSLLLHHSSSASPAPELNHLRRFFTDTPRLPSSSTCKPIAHASKRMRRSESRGE